MKQTQLFTKTKKEASSDETSRNAQLLLRAGFIHKEMAGVYSLLPLGLRVINKIKNIVSEEMENIGSQEIIMSTLQNKEIWEKTGRWSDDKVDVWFKSKLKNGTDVGFGWSHEEPITEMMKSHIGEGTPLPVYVHQFQNKLRNETRAKAGIMRCREFIMKDMYSYCATEEDHNTFYNQSIEAYMRVYNRVGLGEHTYVTSASGGAFTDKFSHEFQTICEAGEDVIYVHNTDKLALNEEIFNDETLLKLGKNKEDFTAKKAAEVGNIFTFGTEKCEQMGLSFTDKDGIKKPVYLGSYGVGITRLMGVVTEMFADEKGIIWPDSIAPFKVHILSFNQNEKATELYSKMRELGIEVLLDDRDERPGSKLADADLIGIPYRVVISEKSLAAGGFEVKKRRDSESRIIDEETLISILNK